MKSKTPKELIQEPAMLSEALSGVTFSHDDRQFLERQYNGLTEYLKDKLSDSQKFLAEILIDNNSSISDKIDHLTETITEIRRDMKELRVDIKETRVEIKELKIDIKSINVDLIVIHKKILELESAAIYNRQHIDIIEKKVK